MNKKKNLAIISLALSIIAFIPAFILPKSLEASQIFCLVFILIALIGIILGFLSRKEAKPIAVSGIVFGILAIILLGVIMFALFQIKNTKDCIDNGDGSATCEIWDDEIKLPIEYLTEEQLKK